MKYLYIFLLLGFFACGGSSENEIISIDQIPIEEGELLIDRVVFLDSSSDEMLGAELKALATDQGFFISNYDGAKYLHHFGLEGDYLGPVITVGEAPGQVPRFEEFRIKGDSLIVNVGTGGHQELVFFLVSSHEFVKNIVTESSGFSFLPNSDGSFWIYSGFNRAVDDYRLQKLDGAGKVIERWMFNDFNEKIIPFAEQSIFEGDGRLLVRDPLFPLINEIGKDSLRQSYQFDFGAYSIPPEVWDIQDPMEWFDAISSNGFGDFNMIFENEEFFVGDLVYQKEDQRFRKLLVLDRISGESKIYETNEENEPQYYSPFALQGDHLLFIAYAPALLEVVESLNASDVIKTQLSRLKEESNPVILYAKLK